jgi:phosphoribosylglycinamide formyltransferase-1
MTRFGILASTGGGVLSQMVASSWFRERLAVVVTDRQCGAEGVALSAGISTVRVMEKGQDERDNAIVDALDAAGVEQVMLFYTRLVGPRLLSRYQHRLWNLHPSLLPSFPGLHGFEDTIASSATIGGTTLHLVDDGVDTGPVLLQTAFPLDRSSGTGKLRHQVFIQQLRCAMQTCHWLDAGRVLISHARCHVVGAPGSTFIDGALYSPGLDEVEVVTIAVPDHRAFS